MKKNINQQQQMLMMKYRVLLLLQPICPIKMNMDQRSILPFSELLSWHIFVSSISLPTNYQAFSDTDECNNRSTETVQDGSLSNERNGSDNFVSPESLDEDHATTSKIYEEIIPYSETYRDSAVKDFFVRQKEWEREIFFKCHLPQDEG